MTICRAFDEWIDKKVDALEVDEQLWIPKCVGYGVLSGIPDVLAIIGLMTLGQVCINAIQEKVLR